METYASQSPIDKSGYAEELTTGDKVDPEASPISEHFKQPV